MVKYGVSHLCCHWQGNVVWHGVELVWHGRGVVWYMVKYGVSHKMLPLSQNYSPILSSRWAQIVLLHCGVVSYRFAMQYCGRGVSICGIMLCSMVWYAFISHHIQWSGIAR